MPRIIYTPTGVETPYTFDFDFKDMDSTQAMLVEKLTGLDFGTDIPERFFKQNMRVLHALLFVMAKAQGVIPANTSAGAFKFTQAEIELDMSTWEAQVTYDGMASHLDELDDSERAVFDLLGAREDVDTHEDDVEPVAVDEVDEAAPKA